MLLFGFFQSIKFSRTYCIAMKLSAMVSTRLMQQSSWAFFLLERRVFSVFKLEISSPVVRIMVEPWILSTYLTLTKPLCWSSYLLSRILKAKKTWSLSMTQGQFLLIWVLALIFLSTSFLLFPLLSQEFLRKWVGVLLSISMVSVQQIRETIPTLSIGSGRMAKISLFIAASFQTLMVFIKYKKTVNVL